MHYVIGSQLGWAYVPFIFAVGVAYVWIVDRLLGEQASVRPSQKAPSVPKAA